MPATSVYKSTDYDSENLSVPVDLEISSDESDLSLDDLPDLDIPVVESDLPAQVNRSSTDLVRLYL
ncbi:MAG: RNA polymerase sigma factor, RpoD/SigA family, partial [Dolichospermum sp.]